MDHRVAKLSKRMGGGRQADQPYSPTATMTALEAQNVIRRFGWMLMKVHELVITELTKRDDGAAEKWNDVVKPIADLMIRFTLEDDSDGA